MVYCKKHDRTALSHIEGFHTGLSGMNFLKTLMKKHRNHLVCIATEIGGDIARLIRSKGHARMSMKDFRMISQKRATVFLAQRVSKKGNKKEQITDAHAGRYNQMDKMRCLENLVQFVLGRAEAPYSDALHRWYTSWQSTKRKADSETMVNFYKLSTSANMTSYIASLKGARPRQTVNRSTAFVNLCEHRQAINEFGAGRVAHIVSTASRSAMEAKKLQAALECKKVELVSNPHEAAGVDCFAVRLCRVAHEMLAPGVSARQKPNVSSSAVAFATVGPSPKCTTEGIP